MIFFDFKKGYYYLYARMADAIDCIDTGDPQRAKSLLVAAHQHTEKMVMDEPDGVAIGFPRKKERQTEEVKER